MTDWVYRRGQQVQAVNDAGDLTNIHSTAEGHFVFSFTDDVTLQPGETVTLAVRSVTATATCIGQLNTREDQ